MSSIDHGIVPAHPKADVRNEEDAYVFKVSRTALTGLGWYDFVGTEYGKERFLESCQELDNVFKHYSHAEAMTISRTNSPAGLELSRYYVHLGIARSILLEHGIQTEPLVFILEAQIVVFKEGDVRRDAITALYERNVSEEIEKNWQALPVAYFVPLSETFL